ncbi:uncharacterized protein N7477_007785 [Penicillium maclennaniae]|uniref:uncharacterized protein n=1 Tax=Penicillium maclennaniae TaxID=1343394 RepID=UPI00253F73E9|nr:uncharacterized protein N7477_007785 [Penicillium maclennaniae]KAJ5665337.1 hypothetical protein N7477_007785 [Penicillium maclennaniae]
MLHAFLSIIESIAKRPVQAHSRSTQANGFDHIRAPTKATVNKDIQLVEYLWAMSMEFQQDGYCKGSSTSSSTTMVAHHKTIKPDSHGNDSIFQSLNSLEQNKLLRTTSQPSQSLSHVAKVQNGTLEAESSALTLAVNSGTKPMDVHWAHSHD